MAKYLIVVWKWNLRDERGTLKCNDFIDFIDEGNKRFEVEVEPKANEEELNFIGFTKSNSFSNSQQYTDQDIIDECSSIFSNNDDNQVLILLHEGGDDKFGETHKQILLNNFKNKKIKARLFHGGTGKFYDELVVENQSYFKINAILNPLAKNTFQIKREKFLSVWDWYWNKLELENLKKDIINLWLPLAIDIQGLSEVKNGKRESYIKEVLEELDKIENCKSYAETLIEGWEKLKEILAPADARKEVLDNNYRLNNDEKNKVKFPIEKETDTNGNLKILEVATLKDFVEKNYEDKNNPHFLPNWLQEVVKVIDKKIGESSNEVKLNEAPES